MVTRPQFFLIVESVTEANGALWSIYDKALKHIRQVGSSGEWLAIQPSDVLGQYLFMIGKDNALYGTSLPYGCVGD